MVFLGAGIPTTYRGIHATANPINFSSFIRPPKLVVQGRYDEDTPPRTAMEPFYKLLSEPKQLFGHVPSIEVTMAATRDWLDQHLGKVAR